ncbi:hypothetical protein L083_2926 [Actinoplanes sp. N902-109]|nr:hypothetical protein L083_2926 [Actinoplanes sp. N902-109]
MACRPARINAEQVCTGSASGPAAHLIAVGPGRGDGTCELAPAAAGEVHNTITKVSFDDVDENLEKVAHGNVIGRRVAGSLAVNSSFLWSNDRCDATLGGAEESGRSDVGKDVSSRPHRGSGGRGGALRDGGVHLGLRLGCGCGCGAGDDRAGRSR